MSPLLLLTGMCHLGRDANMVSVTSWRTRRRAWGIGARRSPFHWAVVGCSRETGSKGLPG